MTDDLQEVKFLKTIEPYIVELAEVTEIGMERLRRKYLDCFRRSIRFYGDFISRKIWAKLEFQDWLRVKEAMSRRDMDAIFDPLEKKEIEAREREKTERQAREDRGESVDATIIPLFSDKNKK